MKDETHAGVHRHQRSLQGMARISHLLEPTSSRNGSRGFAASDQAEKNRPVKNVLLEKLQRKNRVLRSLYQRGATPSGFSIVNNTLVCRKNQDSI